MPTITVPPADPDIEAGYQAARRAIDELAPSRLLSVKLDVSAWRKVIERIDPHGTNGYAFRGLTLQPGASANLPAGTLIISVDRYFAMANWYPSDWRKGEDAGIEARVYEVQADGSLSVLVKSQKSRTWAQELLGWLATNRHLPAFNASTRTSRVR